MVFAARSMLPAGFMVQPSAANGSLEIVICTSSGSKHITINADGKPVPAQPVQSDHAQCPFAAAGMAALASGATALLVAEVEFASVIYVVTAARFQATPKPGATSARGPPSFQA